MSRRLGALGFTVLGQAAIVLVGPLAAAVVALAAFYAAGRLLMPEA